MIETRRLENGVTFFQTILSFQRVLQEFSFSLTVVYTKMVVYTGTVIFKVLAFIGYVDWNPRSS